LLILGIDTSGKNASVAVCSENEMLAQYFVKTQKTHSQVILPLCEKMLSDLEISVNDIDRFAVAAGPGSYTGLRIGVSAIKALAFGLDKKCNGISTLEAIAYNFKGNCGVVCSVMKARLDIVYCAVFRVNRDSVERLTEDKMLKVSELYEELCGYDEDIIFAGDTAKDFISTYQNKNFVLAPAHLRMQLATGICMSAAEKEGCDPEEIDALYMQITKAEKDLIEKN